jgi:hypothetical protein
MSAQPKGDPVSRAFAAYFKYCDRIRYGGQSRSEPAPWVDQPSSGSGVVEHKGKEYVVLENCNGVLAVYRIRNNGYLKQLRRWPTEVVTQN